MSSFLKLFSCLIFQTAFLFTSFGQTNSDDSGNHPVNDGRTYVYEFHTPYSTLPFESHPSVDTNYVVNCGYYEGANSDNSDGGFYNWFGNQFYHQTFIDDAAEITIDSDALNQPGFTHWKFKEHNCQQTTINLSESENPVKITVRAKSDLAGLPFFVTLNGTQNSSLVVENQYPNYGDYKLLTTEYTDYTFTGIGFNNLLDSTLVEGISLLFGRDDSTYYSENVHISIDRIEVTKLDYNTVVETYESGNHLLENSLGYVYNFNTPYFTNQGWTDEDQILNCGSDSFNLAAGYYNWFGNDNFVQTFTDGKAEILVKKNRPQEFYHWKFIGDNCSQTYLPTDTTSAAKVNIKVRAKSSIEGVPMFFTPNTTDYDLMQLVVANDSPSDSDFVALTDEYLEYNFSTTNFNSYSQIEGISFSFGLPSANEVENPVVFIDQIEITVDSSYTHTPIDTTTNPVDTNYYAGDSGNGPSVNRDGYIYNFRGNDSVNCLESWNLFEKDGYSLRINEQYEAMEVSIDGTQMQYGVAAVRFTEGLCDIASIGENPIDISSNTEIEIRLRSDVDIPQFYLLHGILDDNQYKVTDLDAEPLSISGDNQWRTYIVQGGTKQFDDTELPLDKSFGFAFNAVDPNNSTQPQGTIQIDYIKFGSYVDTTSSTDTNTVIQHSGNGLLPEGKGYVYNFNTPFSEKDSNYVLNCGNTKISPATNSLEGFYNWWGLPNYEQTFEDGNTKITINKNRNFAFYSWKFVGENCIQTYLPLDTASDDDINIKVLAKSSIEGVPMFITLNTTDTNQYQMVLANDSPSDSDFMALTDEYLEYNFSTTDFNSYTQIEGISFSFGLPSANEFENPVVSIDRIEVSIGGVITNPIDSTTTDSTHYTGNQPTESRDGFNYEFLLNDSLNCLNLWNVNGASGYDFHVNEEDEAIAIEMDGSGVLAAEVRFSEGECDTTSIINDPIDLTGKTNVELRLRSDVPVDSFLVMLSYLDDNGIVQQADLNGASIALSGDGEWITFTVDLAGFFGESQRVASFTDRVVGFSFRAVNNDGSQPQGTIEIDYMKFGADEKVTSVVEAKTYAVNVYPNPSSGVLNIVTEAGLSISLMDAMGVEIAKGSEKLFVEGLQAGIYITAIYDENGSVVETRKVIVK